MLYPLSVFSLLLLSLVHLTHTYTSTKNNLEDDPIHFETRAYWMRRANAALAELDSPCPFAAFGTVIVNHTDTSSNPHGKLVCMDINQSLQTGNPTLHGEMSAINYCAAILTDPDGEYKFSPSEAANAFPQLSLYTNAEPCPMCASAIRWTGFAECIYGTSIATLVSRGWNQILIPSEEVFEASRNFGEARLIGDVLSNETDAYFSWQFDKGFACPRGCERVDDGNCGVVEEGRRHREL